MSREFVRKLKRELQRHEVSGPCSGSSEPGRESALALLARSIRFGHGRLALIRLCAAVRLGANVPEDHWRYCRQVSVTDKDGRLCAMFLLAERDAVSQRNTVQPENLAETSCTR